MSASKDTVEKILEVVVRHVGTEDARKIVNDLMDVPGNQSFRETVMRLDGRLRDREAEVGGAVTGRFSRPGP